jgi:hypothetical protein
MQIYSTLNLILLIFNRLEYVMALAQNNTIRVTSESLSEVIQIIRRTLPRNKDLATLVTEVWKTNTMGAELVLYRALQLAALYEKHFVGVSACFLIV